MHTNVDCCAIKEPLEFEIEPISTTLTSKSVVEHILVQTSILQSEYLVSYAAIVKKTCLEAIYVHWANHNLNFAITYVCEIASNKNCLGTLSKL